MHRFILFLVFLFVLAGSSSLSAADAEIKKVLPHFLDGAGRNTLSPSLFERDAYQVYLRQNPKLRSTIRFDVNWKAKAGDNLKLRLELRSLNGNQLKNKTLEETVAKKGWFSSWTSMKIDAADYKQFGELVAWRATLWDGEKQLSEQKSFLW